MDAISKIVVGSIEEPEKIVTVVEEEPQEEEEDEEDDDEEEDEEEEDNEEEDNEEPQEEEDEEEDNEENEEEEEENVDDENMEGLEDEENPDTPEDKEEEEEEPQQEQYQYANIWDDKKGRITLKRLQNLEGTFLLLLLSPCRPHVCCGIALFVPSEQVCLEGLTLDK